MIRLVQEFGAHAGRSLTFERNRVRVGRAPDGDVVFDANIDLDASGRHCELLLVDGVWNVADAGSRNGTFVNGVRVQRQQLKHGDVVECGRGGPRLRVEITSGTQAAFPGVSTAPAGSPPAAAVNPFAAPSPPGVNPFAAPAPPPPANPTPAPPPAAAPPVSSFAAPSFAAPIPLPQAPPPPPPSPQQPPPPQGNPFVGGVPVASQPAFGGGSGTVAMDRVPSIPAMSSPPATAPLAGPLPSPMAPPGHPPMQPGSVGQAMASSLPSNAQVGKRTVALMIDQALAAQQARAPSHRGLIVAVAALSVLMLASIAAGAWYVLQRDDDRPSRNSPPVANDPSSVGARIAAANEGNIYLLAMRQTDGRVRGFCTGFSVNENTIATNAHCVRVITQETARGASLVALRNKGNGEMIPATAVYLDARFQNNTMSRGGAGYDVGLVQTTARLPGWVTLSPDTELQALREGDAVFVYGFPGMTMNERSPVATITLGLLNRLTDFYDNVATPQTAQKLQHSAQTSGGSSGSPIFLPSGTVIGVNAGSLSDDERQVVIDPSNGQRREVEVNRGSNFKYGMRSDLIRQAMASVNARLP